MGVKGDVEASGGDERPPFEICDSLRERTNWTQSGVAAGKQQKARDVLFCLIETSRLCF